MSVAVLVAIITGSITLIGTVISNMLNHSKTIYRLDQLERKVEAHNHLVERMYINEGKIAVLEQKQEDIDSDLNDLKKAALS